MNIIKLVNLGKLNQKRYLKDHFVEILICFIIEKKFQELWKKIKIKIQGIKQNWQIKKLKKMLKGFKKLNQLDQKIK